MVFYNTNDILFYMTYKDVINMSILVSVSIIVQLKIKQTLNWTYAEESQLGAQLALNQPVLNSFHGNCFWQRSHISEHSATPQSVGLAL